jgi:hypothetical protein
MIYDIYEITDNNRCQISRLEAKDLDQCVKMVLDYYVKPEFHKHASEDYADNDLIYLTIPDLDYNDEEFDSINDLTFEIHVSDDQETRDFNLITGHNEFITLDSDNKPNTPFSLGKLLDNTKKLEELLK